MDKATILPEMANVKPKKFMRSLEVPIRLPKVAMRMPNEVAVRLPEVAERLPEKVVRLPKVLKDVI